MPTILDSTAVRVHPVDSTVDVTLLGDRVTTVIQWIFQQPPWVMWGGAVLAAVIAALVVRWLWPRRLAITRWVVTRSFIAKVAMVGTAVVAVAATAGLGVKSYEFVETDKRFCTGCHIFVPSGQAWVQPDTGYYSLVPRLEGKHDSLNCHACHALKPLKEAVKLAFWMSGFRDEHIPSHAKVPREVCEQCHVRGAAQETWQAIATTAGHRAHLESDSSALKDKVECLTCHARTAHRFLPADSTCVQRGCHLTDDTRIEIGKMAAQTELHCTVCHKFAQPVALLATRDSAAGTLRPAQRQCLSCHDMERLVGIFSTQNDPHGGTCGMCHNPHVQRAAGGARTSCTTAGCHADWKKAPFHVGAAHRKVSSDCTLCHQPHATRVDASDCVACHTAVRERTTGRVVPPLPFDTLEALKTIRESAAPEPAGPAAEQRPVKGKGDAPPAADPPGSPVSLIPTLPSDTFSHPRHKTLPCLTCHLSTRPESPLTFEAPRGCQICHHEEPAAGGCATCHTSEELATPAQVSVTIAAADSAPRHRTVSFRHAAHEQEVRCVQCHTTAVSLAPADSAASCTACHAEHHAAGRDCAVCHRTDATFPAHVAPTSAHERCDACHAGATVDRLVPARSFCLACHETEVDHHEPIECSSCHLQSDPEVWRPRLRRAGAAP